MKDHTDLSFNLYLGFFVLGVKPVYKYVAACGLIKPVKHFCKRRLARTVMSQNYRKAAPFDIKGKIFYGGKGIVLVRIFVGYVFYFDYTVHSLVQIVVFPAGRLIPLSVI